MFVNALTAVHWLSVLLAFVAYFLLGALWYLLLFPKLYRVSLGKENEPDTGQNQQPIFIVGPAVCALIITITCAVLLRALHIAAYGPALGFALVVGLGYLFTNTVNIAINPNIPRPFLYGFITGSYHLVGMVLVNLILVAVQ
ncbi:DUF1761 domain-containing protein [Hymenobacter sp. M29]|uniref:DUF1761 domain-containing protein n=1 Tax=Hymenobacter mellowenesis TaxID=3063995 RepID=A0ABT9A7G4_9BACT|nr:DUF1761 domain-containing protein [Hymenobacter sp. M29]MDO7845774.1 DUF1761 domain-containing protein [Hymenobacter sp. M29]